MKQNILFNSLLSNPYTLRDIDGNLYTTVTIGSQEWIVQNYRATKYANNTSIPKIDGSAAWAADLYGAYCVYNNDLQYVNPYGYLYNWYAVDKRYDDWFLPSRDELKKVYDNVYLYLNEGPEENPYDNALYWSSSEDSFEEAYQIDFADGQQNLSTKDLQNYFIPVRSFVDVSTAYAISDVGPAGGWISDISIANGIYTYYEASPPSLLFYEAWSNVLDEEVGTTGIAVGTGKNNTLDIIAQIGHEYSAAKICADKNDYIGLPYFKRNGVYEAGWNVPSAADFTTLSNFLGGDTSAGKRLKEIGNTHWAADVGQTNDTGFTAVGAGYRGISASSGVYDGMMLTNTFFTNEVDASGYSPIRLLTFFDDSFDDGNADKRIGLSIRCVKDLDASILLKFMIEASTSAFTPYLSTTSGTLKWNLGDASYNVIANDLTHNYTTSGNKYIKVMKGMNSGNITLFQLERDGIVGILDISSLTSAQYIHYGRNSKLTSVINPVSSAPITSYYGQECNLQGTLDISGLTDIGGVFYVTSNSSLSTILNPVSSRVFSQYSADRCNLTGTLDISGLTGFAGCTFDVMFNPRLNYILNPSINGSMWAYYANNCGLMGTVDMRSIKGFVRNFQLHSNSSLNRVLIPDSSIVTSMFYIYSCAKFGPTLDISSLTGLGGIISLYSNPSLNTIIFPNSSQNISTLNAYSCDLTGTLDVSSLTNLGGSFKVYSNKQLTSILNPSSNQTFSEYWAYDCSLKTLDLRPLKRLGGDINLGFNSSLNDIKFTDSSVIITSFKIENTDISTLDISCLTKLGGTFWVYSNKNLTKIINPISSQSFNSYLAYSNKLTGTLDVSGLTGLAGSILIDNNPSLNKILFPSSSESVVCTVNTCDLTGTLDVSGFKKLSNIFYCYDNPNLQNVLIADLSDNIYTFKANNCSLNTGNIDDILGKFDVWFSAHTPTSDLSINLTGTKMAKPGALDGSVYINNLKNTFIAAGKVARIDTN